MSSNPGRSVEIGSRLNAGAMTRAERLAQLPLWKQLVFLAFWPLLEQLLSFVVGTTDTLIGGRFPDAEYRRSALDALGLGIYLMWLQSIVQMAVATGGTALVSRSAGKGDTQLARRATQQTLLLSLSAGIGMALLLWLSIPQLMSLFTFENELTRELAVEYLRIQALAAPFSGLVFAINACRRGSGDTLTGFLTMLLVNGVNVALSWLLTLGPWGDWGMSGLAWGTVAGWAMGAALAVVWLLFPKQELRPLADGWKFHVSLVKRILRVGVPSGVEILGMWAVNFFLIWMMASMLPESDGLIGAHTIVIRCESLAFLPAFALAMATGALCGQYLGREDKQGAQSALMLGWRTGVIFMGLMGVVFFFYAEELVALIAPGDAQIIALAAPILQLCGLQQPALATCVLLKSTFRAIGDAKTVMKYAWASQLLLRVGGAWLLAVHWELGLQGIWYAMIADVVLQAIIFSRRALSRRWIEVKV